MQTLCAEWDALDAAQTREHERWARWLFVLAGANVGCVAGYLGAAILDVPVAWQNYALSAVAVLAVLACRQDHLAAIAVLNTQRRRRTVLAAVGLYESSKAVQDSWLLFESTGRERGLDA
jgi:predicted benzoate:H+ symporter BenE